MSDLSGKIMIAEAFQIISPVDAEYLHAIRRVRNAFAHSSIPLNFSMPEVQDATANLMKLLKQMKGVFDAMVKVAPPEWNLTEFDLNMRPRSAFRLIVQLLVITLDGAHRATGGNRLYENTRTFDPARRSQRVDAGKA